VRESEGSGRFDDTPDRVRHVVPLFREERVPPIAEFLSELDLSDHPNFAARRKLKAVP